MNEILNEEKIENKIYEIRGKQVMLDSDLARIYRCVNGTKSINLAVKRHIERFPTDFYFQLTEEECLRFQFETLNSKGNLRGQHIKYLPYVFTEQGVAMLASVLRTDAAAIVSVDIMRAFVKMRHYLLQNKELLPKRVLQLEEKVDDNTKKINELFDKFDEKEIETNKIFYDGQIYDAYSFLLDILSTSKKEIIIVDNYASKELLDTLKNIDRKVIIISSNIDEKLKEKYESQYKNITFIQSNSFHDRFIVIDKTVVYTCGASFKDLGKKCFAMSKIDSDDTRKYFISRINGLKNKGDIYE